jgi:iron(III) transport system substrate-binding protein
MRWLFSLATSLAILGTSVLTASAQQAPGLAAITDPAERQRVETMIAGAKKEGKLEWVGIMIEPAHAKIIGEEFKRWYGLDNVKVEYTYADSGQITSRVNQLIGARTNNFDVVWIVNWGWYADLLKRGEILKYDSPYYKDYTLSNKSGLSKPGYWVSDAYTFSPTFNVKAMEKLGLKNWNPTSWNDFVDPRLKGLMSMADITISTSNQPGIAGVVKVMGDKWMDDLAANVKPVLWTKSAQGRDWIASGEFPVGLFSHAKNTISLLERNIDTRLVYPKEGVVLLPFAPIILEKAPHKDAARLFIDFVRSAHGAQTVMDSGALLFFGRPGVKSPNADLLPPWEDLNLIAFDWDTEGSTEALRAIRDRFVKLGIGH